MRKLFLISIVILAGFCFLMTNANAGSKHPHKAKNHSFNGNQSVIPHMANYNGKRHGNKHYYNHNKYNKNHHYWKKRHKPRYYNHYNGYGYNYYGPWNQGFSFWYQNPGYGYGYHYKKHKKKGRHGYKNRHGQKHYYNH